MNDPKGKETLDHSSREEFYEYYKDQSISPSALERLNNIHVTLNRELGARSRETLDIVDIGCGAGTLCTIWARDGHRVHGIDVNEPLINLARERAEKDGLEIDYRVGTATQLPWPDSSMDVCMVPELLEHVEEWEACLDEFSRVLRSNGLLYLSTNNKLCPVQQEFELPLYSWYPGFVKRYCEKLAKTTRPHLTGYATYPAVNWFTYNMLRKEFDKRGMVSKDRFDLIDYSSKGRLARLLLSIIKSTPLTRFVAYVFTPYTRILGRKR